MSRRFGAIPGDFEYAVTAGTNTGLLINATNHLRPLLGQPRMSAVPVDVIPAGHMNG